MDLRQSYEEVPYPDLCYAQTHPTRLFLLSTLLGMTPAPVERCRVLEVGCASGGNLLPVAATYPESTFVGLDFSPRQIASGQAAVDALGLENVSLRAQDIRDFDPSAGPFDYIIAHGFYSWVPQDVRDHFMRLLRQLLAPQGVAYVSYNTYPGWHMMGAIRQMMQYRTRRLSDTEAKSKPARDYIQFLARWAPNKPISGGSFGALWSEMLNQYASFMEHSRDPGEPDPILHDELEVFNHPVLFQDFIDHATQNTLQYIAEADFSTINPTNIHPNIMPALAPHIQDLIELEQAMDFLRNRAHRQTLLCHQEVNLQRTLNINLQQLHKMRLRSRAKPTERVDIAGQTPATFKGGKAELSVDHPVTKAALVELIQRSPESITFQELAQFATKAVLPEDTAADVVQREQGLLAFNIIRAFTTSADLVDLRLGPDHFVQQVSERPMASALARYQAQRGPWVVNQLHERVQLDPAGQKLLSLLDGERTGSEIVKQYISMVPNNGDPEAQVKEFVMRLQWMAQSALLVR